MKLTRNIFSPVSLIISILLLFYIFYRSEIVWSGERRDYYEIYFIISILLIIFSIITFYINETIKTYIIITLSTIIFTLYVFEGYLSAYGKIGVFQLVKKIKIYKEQTGKQYDTRSSLKVYEDLKKNNEGIIFTVTPQYYEQKKIHSLSGISNARTIFCNENGYQSIYKSDRYGFNNPDDEWDKKDIKFLLLGDSFIHGQCVNRPHDITSVLRTLSKKSALNLGYRGNGPLTELAILREYLRPGVKNILWFYFENSDIYDLESELKSKTLLNYIEDSNFTQNLINKQNIVDEVAKKEMKRIFDDHKSVKLIKLYRVRNFLKEKIISNTGKQLNVQWEFKEILKQANNLALRNNSKLYFIYLPHYARYKINYKDPNYESVKKIINELNIPFIDIHKEVFEKEKEPLELFPFQMYGHYTLEGYKKISEKIYQIINGNKMTWFELYKLKQIDILEIYKKIIL